MREILRRVRNLIVASVLLSCFLFSLSLQASSGQPKTGNTSDLGILNNLVLRKIEELKEIRATVLLMKTKADVDGESQMNANIASEIQKTIASLEVKKTLAKENPKKMQALISEVISEVYRAKNRRRDLEAAPSY